MIDLARAAEFEVGGVGVKPALRLFGGAPVEPRVMQVLVALAGRAGEVVSRDDLVTQCWDGRVVSEDAIQRPIARLRKLGDDSGAFEIETITKVGYRLIDPQSASAKSDAAASEGRDVVLAVLAFDDLSPQRDMGFFSDAVSDEILQIVSRAMKTIGRASSFQFRGADKAVRKLAAELGATHVLDGSVRRNEDTVRVSAQLIDAATQQSVWQSQYERPSRDLFAVQDEIATAVASALNCRLSKLYAGGRADADNYEKVLRARDARCSRSANDEAIALLLEVIERAPNFAPAWLELALTRIWRLRRAGVPPEERGALFDEARFAADEAIRASGDEGVARQLEVELQPTCGGWTEREAVLRQLLAKRPHDILLLTPLCWALSDAGRLAEALPLARQIYELEPLHAGTIGCYASLLGGVGRHDEELALYESACRRYPETQSIWASLVTSAAQIGRWDVIERNTKPQQLSRFPKDAPMVRSVLRTVARHREPLTDQGEGLLSRLSQNLDRADRLSLSAIGAVAEVADLDRVYALLERASFSHLFDVRDGNDLGDGGPQMLFVAYAKRLRSDVRFVKLCARLGIVAHWIETDRWPTCETEVRYDFRGEARRLHEQRLDLRERGRSA